ncbi:glycine zipper 2TM domain-containing protein [Ramlibacter sp.]|uniref:glycine zipper 2TM domain-containing protein n=1 Tax=Ramlibacter sp. TaxID=1917967 RepID=UPI0017ED7752|nr:glycine zipper 2TM domain-containing protein [Ramlibacter sp.]MBA2672260.1 glycine zipper 2TM domain-containing protein [Ramlibacter sp.]
MKKAVLSMMGLVAVAAGAQEVGRVVSTVPLVQQVAVPRQYCSQQQVVQQQSSGGGALIGAVVGGLLGNTIGHGFGRAAATGVGAVVGAGVGNSIETRDGYPQAVQQCATQNSYENRTVGYNVTYEFGGRQYTTQMPYDPGPTVRLQVTPMGSGPAPAYPAAQPMPGTVSAPPMVSAPPSGYEQQFVEATPAIVQVPSTYVYPATTVVYPAYAPRYYYPPVSLSIGLGGYWGGGHRHHWR